MNTSPWNKERIIGQKRPLQISHIWGIRIRLELEGKTRDLALFNTHQLGLKDSLNPNSQDVRYPAHRLLGFNQADTQNC